jgi:hypothetical protein
MVQHRSLWTAAGRTLVGLAFVAGASYNLLVTLRAPAGELRRLVALSPLAAYRRLAGHLALGHPAGFVVTVILLEFAIAVSMVLPRRWRRCGYVTALAFFVVLVPLLGWYALTNVLWAVPDALLFHYDRTAGWPPSAMGEIEGRGR